MSREYTGAPVIGFKVLSAGPDHRLESLNGTRWTAEPQRASCATGGHPAPDPEHLCGIYAYSELEPALDDANLGVLQDIPRPVVVAVACESLPGVPLLVDRLAAGEGFQIRAPLATIVALLDSPEARLVGERLGVPVVPERDMLGRPAFVPAAMEHGVRVPDAPVVPDTGAGHLPASLDFHPLDTGRDMSRPTATDMSMGHVPSPPALDVQGHVWWPGWLTRGHVLWLAVAGGVAVLVVMAGDRHPGGVLVLSVVVASAPFGWMALRPDRRPGLGSLVARVIGSIVVGPMVAFVDLAARPLLAYLRPRARGIVSAGMSRALSLGQRAVMSIAAKAATSVRRYQRRVQ